MSIAGTLVGTDGACKGNPGPAGWCWVAPDGTAHLAGTPRGTNQFAELAAILLALQDHPDGPLTIQTDSAYAIGCSSTWKAGWQQAGYRRGGQPLSNLEVIRPIHVLLDTRGAPVTFVKVKGHDPAGRWPLNLAADTGAVMAADAADNTGRMVDLRTVLHVPVGNVDGPTPGAVRPPMLSASGVKARAGWTDTKIARWLGDPDELQRNPKYKGAAPMRMYLVDRVEAAEADPSWALPTRRAASSS